MPKAVSLYCIKEETSGEELVSPGIDAPNINTQPARLIWPGDGSLVLGKTSRKERKEERDRTEGWGEEEKKEGCKR